MVRMAGNEQMLLKEFIAKFYGFMYANVWDNIVVLIAMWVWLQLAIYLTLRFVSYLNR
jgi:CDR ABC transporter